MTTSAPQLKLVSDPIEREISEVAGEMSAAVALTGEYLPPGGFMRYDDMAICDRFLRERGGDMLYCTEAKKWMIWQGTHWGMDQTDFVFDHATEFVEKIYQESRSVENDAARKTAIAEAAKRCNVRGFNAFMNFAQRKQTVGISEFDTQPRLLNCLNGTLELKTGTLRPHDRADRITRYINCNYDADARSDVFERFIERIQPDPAVRAFLQRSIGYSLLGSVRERSFWILYGTGNNGKSIFTDLFNRLLGEYAATTTTATIMAGKQNGIPNDIARLKGKRFVVVPETEENERMNAALVKALSAGDKVSARFLFCEYFDFEFSAKLWIATNHKPTITDHSKGFWDRIKLIPFNADIRGDEVIKKDDLLDQLMADAPAILAWAVQGCRDYFDIDGLDTPPAIQAEIDAYKKEQDSIAQFLEERCQTIEVARELREGNAGIYFSDAEFQISNSDLYKAYEKFCKDNGEYQRSHRRLTQNMKERGFLQGNSGGRFWQGIRLVNLD